MSNELCYDLCVHTKQGPLDIQYAQACISDTATAVTCYNEGLGKLYILQASKFFISQVTSLRVLREYV